MIDMLICVSRSVLHSHYITFFVSTFHLPSTAYIAQVSEKVASMLTSQLFPSSKSVRLFLLPIVLLLLWTRGRGYCSSHLLTSTSAAVPLRRELPEKVIVGYASECNDKVVIAIQQGVNVVIWAFYHLSPTAPPPPDEHDDPSSPADLHFLQGKLDLQCIQDMMEDLDQRGFQDTVHLVSMGGWNGPHLDPYFKSAAEWFAAWKALVGNVFHGIDIDFEGDDDLTSDRNYMSVAELDMVGGIMQLAKESGYIISIVPAQSYLDIQSTKFSRYLNLTDPDRTWHADFSYFGRNLYAYWLAKYGDFIDLIMIQFYESWSRAAMEMTQNYQTPENYLAQYVWDLNQPSQGPGFTVNFASSDPEVGLPDDYYVALPISKLVWGFANAWANTPENSDRNYYFPPVTIQAAYQNLWDWMLEPRGMMFWNIDNEGEQGIYYARGLNEILHIRHSNSSSEEGEEEESKNDDGKSQTGFQMPAEPA